MMSAERSHLAEILEEEMKERGWDMTTLVINMGPFYTDHDWGVTMLAWEMFFAVREPYVILGDVMAEQLAAAFDMSPKFFTNLHEGWREWARIVRKSSRGIGEKMIDREVIVIDKFYDMCPRCDQCIPVGAELCPYCESGVMDAIEEERTGLRKK